MESASSGLLAGINCARHILGKTLITLPETSMIGALSRYISDESVVKFQPMGANFGILPELENRPRDKKQRAEAYSSRGLDELKNMITQQNLNE
ncbi:MAG: methylenetetrahydrofolate--tRNA-(uracil(54)-C(5))-methyltransferase (FADH(2)-oxidizing) TrmFO, partial [Ruminococcus sp.]|nr:methylenetetrahydrofolate--tRNA-(uracil(54)-C(5))-methyltransferase (FADH(2)-oxidizing) TrmFO [Ruminococcus sp.]